MAAVTVKVPRIEYHTSERFELFPASGAFGGPVPTDPGLIQCNFFMDTTKFPDQANLVPAPERPGQFKEPDDTYSTGIIQRTILTAVLLTPEQALTVSDWLRRHAEALLSAKRPSA